MHIQQQWRAYVSLRSARWNAAAMRLQSAFRAYMQRRAFVIQRYAAIRIQVCTVGFPCNLQHRLCHNQLLTLHGSVL